MIRKTITLGALAVAVIAPAAVRAQTTVTPPPICDCPVGDARGDLRNLAAFAPLGLLGALAAAGGAPALFAGNTPAVTPVYDPPAPVEPPRTVGETETPVTERARNVEPKTPTDPPAPDVRRDIPDPVSPDSLRAGIRAPNTGTPLPSVLLLGTSLIAIGSVTLIRSRS
jgi:hypothetical protein